MQTYVVLKNKIWQRKTYKQRDEALCKVSKLINSRAVSKNIQQKFGMMIEEYLKNRKYLKRVFLLVDFRHKPTEDDLLMYNFLKYYQLDVTIVATKYDKVAQKEKAKCEKALVEAFPLKENDNIVLFSSATKKGREEIYSIINNCLSSL